MTKRVRRVEFVLDDSSLVTQEEMQELARTVKGQWIERDDGSQIFLPHIPHLKRVPANE